MHCEVTIDIHSEIAPIEGTTAQTKALTNRLRECNHGK